MSKKSLSQILIIEVTKLLMPLKQLDSKEKVTAFLNELGWSFTTPVDDFNLSELLGIDDLIIIFTELNNAESDEETLEIVGRLAVKIPTIITNISAEAPQIVDIIENSDFAGNTVGIIDVLPLRLLDYLLYRYLQMHYQKVFAVFHLLGIIETVKNQGFSIKTIQWDRIPLLFSDPMTLALKVYKWNDSSEPFDGDEFLERFEVLLRAFLLPGGIYKQANDIREKFGRAGAGDDKEIRMPLFQRGVWPDSWMELDLNLSPIPAIDIDEKKSGLALYPYLTSGLKIEQEIADKWILEISGNANLDAGFGVKIRAPHNLEIMTGLFENTTEYIDARLEVGLKRTSPADTLSYIFGTAEGSHLALKEAGIKIWVALEDGDEEFGGELNIDDLTICISPAGDADGFIQKLLSGIILESVTDLTIGVSNIEGFYFQGSSALSIVIPIHKSLGPITIDTVTIGIGFGEKIEVILAVSFGFELGPIIGTVDRIGLEIPFSISGDNSGNFGPVQIDDIAFLPPTGIGLSVDAEGIIGGGFIGIDIINERYSGVLALAFGEISITAIGLIETKLPDGKKGFSMVLNICVEFNPPIDLSYGFTLSGIGGLIGINRVMVTEALQRGIKNHTLDSILFPDPDTVVLNASKIISDMRTVFPPEEGRFIVGPMLKLGWGYPTIITAELGLFIELPPDPLRIALMGQINAAFPHEELGLLLINMDILGVLDTEKQELTFQASLFDSCMMSYPNKFSITGDAAFLLNWGNTPDFALAVGGFHPKYDPPLPDYIFSDLRRMQMTVTYYVVVQLSCKAYLALTTNSLQFGARVELFVSELGFDIGGGVGFDTLIYFSPFSFKASICGYLWVKAQGISLVDIYVKAGLSGPNPWNVNGEAKFQVLFFDFSVPFNISWGDEERAVIAPQDPLPQLIDALSGTGNWSSRLPYKRSMVETLRSFEEHEDTPDIIVVHPSGRLEIRQNAVPFNITLKKCGNAPITGHDRFKITGLVAGSVVIDTDYVKEFYSRGQFEELSDDQRLSIPSFEKMDSGVTTSASQSIRFDAGEVENKELNYESILLNPDLTSERVKSVGKANWDYAQKLMAGSAARLSAKEAGSHKRFKDRNMEPKATLQEERYCIVSAVDLLPIDLSEDISSQNLFNTRTEADQAIDSYFSQNPQDCDEILVVPECEVPVSEVA